MWPEGLPKSQTHPTVSLLTPTYNRRAFLPRLVEYILAQTYPLERMEWVVLDDGTDPVADLLEPYKARLHIQYIRSEEKMTIGAKRNRLHAAARGEILVCMDDDDFYFPERVSHAVNTLRVKKTPLCGSSRNHLFFVDDKSVWATGPYTPQHATFGTMAYTKAYAVSHPCDETVLHAEEIAFTRKYTEPLAQLDPMKVMLVICHPNNTFDKRGLRQSPSPVMRKTDLKLRNFMKSQAHRDFYISLSV